ncbi:hypothetical protein X802_04585 [Thermococcus guaymasensis DSM 11113]|uniref:DUF2357 domain-containing protein n=1 Tax=Thermococcus guaymasensis DSM 11113 TaxID=1432656 RepID=A0A0X1KN92_9EURY|nr:nuclease domain-containing protein [Thermococcus guaymasensis]AJC72708.1 hypothetical protein X802_04585 [Thermococcus guaymasensis DSM 11113]
MPSRRLNSPHPIWDNDYTIPLKLLDVVKINGKPLKEFAKSNRIKIANEAVTISLRDLFGTLIIEKPHETRSFLVIPHKLFPQECSPEIGSEFIRNRVLQDIGDFISFIVKEVRDIQALYVFKIVMKEYERSVYFLVVTLEHYLKLLEEQVTRLFLRGPIHKETLTMPSQFGSGVKHSNSSLVSPYLLFNKRSVTYDTMLNRMLFQSFYYVVIESEILKHVLTDKDLLKRVNALQSRALKLIEGYHLWEFFCEAPQNLVLIQERLTTQQNPHYAEVFRVYRELVKIVFSKTILKNIEEGIQYPLLNFATIYETWAVWRIIKGLIERGFKISDEGIVLNDQEKFNRRTKAIFRLEQGDLIITVVWELKFKPETDSLYMGSLMKLIRYVNKIPIKPDLVILVSKKGDNTPKKVLLGDVKFRIDKNNRLPPLETLYKVLGYVVDLGNFDHFKGASIEGMLIYPGRIEMLKIPIIKPEKGKDVLYVNLLPLNSESFEINIVKLLE